MNQKVGKMNDCKYSKNCVAVRYLKKESKDIKCRIFEIKDEIQILENELLLKNERKKNVEDTLISLTKT